MGSNNIKRIMAETNTNIVNTNRFLKEVKSEVPVNFICLDNKGLLLTTNKVAASSDLKIIEKYLKELNNINSNEVMSSKLLQSKSYLKILKVPYFIKDMNTPILSDIVECIIKSTHIFNDIVLVSQPHIIKVSPKLDIVVI